jgi:DNA-binding NarL/FixJ family response regulator
MNRIAVAVLGNDQITREGAVSRLSAFQEVEVLPPDQHKRAEVILILAGQLSDGVLSTMERCGRDNVTTRRPSIVLVANEFREDRVLRAIKFGLVSLLYRQDSGYDRIVQAILSAYAGRAELPNSVLRYVLDQLKSIQNNVLAPRGLTVAGLSDREVDVFRLLAEGFDTAEVATKLNYSERTVKNVIHGAVTRLKLRNRTHAVAYALRSGVL